MVACVAGCSRGERREMRPTAASASGLALGPRITASASATPFVAAPTEANAQADAYPQADAGGSAALNSAPLAIVDGPGLLQKIRDSGHKGVVVNAWASFCDPCREELPMLARVAPKLAELDVPIWLVSVDDPDGFQAARELLASLHVELTSFAAAPPLSDFKTALNPAWPGMIPASFLFDKTGKLRYFWAGEVYEKELMPVVLGFAAGKHIDGVSDFGLAPGRTH